MTRPRRWVAALCLLGVLGAMTAACGSGGDPTPEPSGFPSDLTQEPSGAPVHGATLRYGLSADVVGLDPTTTRWTTQTAIVGQAVFDPLAAYDDRAEPQPYLAASFEPNDDFTEWTISLRPDVRFHDGTVLDAAAVARNLDAAKASPLTGYALDPVSSVDVADPQTVVVTMDTPWSTFLHTLAGPAGLVMAPSMLDDPNGTRHPVGTGPFVFDRWDPGSLIVMHRNADYWRSGLPYLDGVEFRILPGARDRAEALRSGDVDVIETNDPAQIDGFTGLITHRVEAGEEPDLQLFTDEAYETPELVLALNVALAPFDDLRARQALAHAVDTAEISDVASDGVYPPADGPLSEGSPTYADVAWPEHDLEEATRLGEAYRAARGLPVAFTLLVGPEPELVPVVDELRRQLSAAGVTVRVETVGQGELADRVLAGDYQASLLSLFGAPHLDREYDLLAGVPVAAPGASRNVTRNDNPRLRAAMDDARASGDEVEQIDEYKLVQTELSQDLDYLFLVRQTGATVYAADVHGVRDQTLPDGGAGLPSLRTFIAEVWMDRPDGSAAGTIPASEGTGGR